MRVAALAEILLDNWKGEHVDGNAIILACVLHDITKPINFNLKAQAKFGMLQAEIKDLEKIQSTLKLKYGDDEHRAVVEMCREIGCPKTTLRILNNLEWSYLDRLIKESDTESLIAIYCDMRIGPFGILPIEERYKDLLSRKHLDDFEAIRKSGKILEKIIKDKVLIDLNKMTDNQLNIKFEELLNTDVNI